MKTKLVAGLLVGLAVTLSVVAQVPATGGVAEAAAAAIEASKVVTLAGDAILQVSADRAVLRVTVSTEAKTLTEASDKNQRARDAFKESLLKLGLSEERIRSARFSSTPVTGKFSGAVKSHRVENQMRVTVESEAQFRTVTAQIDARPELAYHGLEPVDSKEAENKAAAVAKACEVINHKKAAVEQAMKIKLLPARMAEGAAGPPRPLPVAGMAGAAPAMSSLTGILTDPDFRVVIRALEQRSDDGSGFGEKTYKAFIAAEFQIAK